MTLPNDLARLQQDEPTTDVELLIGSEAEEVTTLRAHRLILMARSPVFRGMFLGSGSAAGPVHLQKAEVVEPDKVRIMNAGPDSVRAFLRFLYTDEVDTTVELEEVLALAANFEVGLLHARLEERLVGEASSARLGSLTSLCCAHRLPRLEAALAPLALADPLLHEREDVQELCKKCPEALLKLLKFVRIGRYCGMLGSWRYATGEYEIQDCAKGITYLEQVSGDVRWSGRLIEDAEHYMCTLIRSDGETHGFLRIRQVPPGKLASNFRQTRDEPWSEDVLASRKSAH